MNDVGTTPPSGRRPLHTPEVAWFGALCDDDYEFLGVPNPALASSFGHCADIVTTADREGFDNVLLPSGYELGIDAVAFAAGVAPMVRNIDLLLAVRCAEMWPPQLARQLASIDGILGEHPDRPGRSRLCVNIISSDLPGAPLPSEARYARTLEVMQILRTLLDGEPLEHHGEFYDLVLDPPRARPVGGASPPFYFGGLSEPAREVAARAAEVYLTWPDTVAATAEVIADLRRRAAAHGRELRFGFRCHVIVRDTEAEARAAAARLISRLDPEQGERIRARSLDTGSAGVARQVELRDAADEDGFVEDHLWTGIGRARSGAGAAIVGDPDQVVAALRAYTEVGVDAFILSGYPHLEECRRVAASVLPGLR
ncbi:MAG: LLM class flavin-dependent oxidoreductase [Microthrixaceae bacterium]